MKVYPLVLGPVQTSCYIVSNHERAVVVDPAANANQIIQYLGMKKLKLEAIFLTHGHFDHIGGSAFFTHVYLQKNEKNVYEYHGDKKFRSGIIGAEGKEMFLIWEIEHWKSSRHQDIHQVR